MTKRDSLMAAFWHGTDPYAGFVHRRFRTDTQGWNSQHKFLKDTIVQTRPSLIVEIGVWKGGSTLHMAKAVQAAELDATIIAVDTWLGSWEHWENRQWFDDLLVQNGYPSLFYTFLTNVVEAKATDIVVPLPLDSANASILLQHKKVQADMIHIDGGHDYDAVLTDLRRWWPILAPGGTFVIDDFDPAGKVWPSVKAAVEDFRLEITSEQFEAAPYKCRFRKAGGVRAAAAKTLPTEA